MLARRKNPREFALNNQCFAPQNKTNMPPTRHYGYGSGSTHSGSQAHGGGQNPDDEYDDYYEGAAAGDDTSIMNNRNMMMVVMTVLALVLLLWIFGVSAY
jgi:hypothetical protein